MTTEKKEIFSLLAYIAAGAIIGSVIAGVFIHFLKLI